MTHYIEKFDTINPTTPIAYREYPVGTLYSQYRVSALTSLSLSKLETKTKIIITRGYLCNNVVAKFETIEELVGWIASMKDDIEDELNELANIYGLL